MFALTLLFALMTGLALPIRWQYALVFFGVWAVMASNGGQNEFVAMFVAVLGEPVQHLGTLTFWTCSGLLALFGFSIAESLDDKNFLDKVRAALTRR